VTDAWWVELLEADPAPWLLASDEPAARWVTLTRVLGRADDDPEVVAAHVAVLDDPLTADLLGRLGDWEAGDAIGGHNSPRYLPNLLALLDDMGVRRSDDARLEAVLQAMLRHQAGDGRFLSFTSWRGMDAPVWAALPCDAHAVAEALVRYGAAKDPCVRAALDRISAGLTDTAEGPGWLCVPDPAVSFRGPGRKADVCPQVTAEALRAFAHAPAAARPAGLLEAARTLLGVWRQRGEVLRAHRARSARPLPRAVDRRGFSRRSPRRGRALRLPDRLCRLAGRHGDTALLLQGLRAALLRPEETAVALCDGRGAGRPRALRGLRRRDPRRRPAGAGQREGRHGHAGAAEDRALTTS